MTIDLSNSECDILISLLTSAITEIKEEICKTEQYEYKDELKNEKQTMEVVLSRLVTISMGGYRPNVSVH